MSGLGSLLEIHPDCWQNKSHREFTCVPFPLGLLPVASADRGICSHRKLPSWSL